MLIGTRAQRYKKSGGLPKSLPLFYGMPSPRLLVHEIDKGRYI